MVELTKGVTGVSSNGHQVGFLHVQHLVDLGDVAVGELLHLILGAALVRLLNSQHYEYEKFVAANTNAKDISLSILRLFAGLIPVIIFSANLAIES